MIRKKRVRCKDSRTKSTDVGVTYIIQVAVRSMDFHQLQ